MSSKWQKHMTEFERKSVKEKKNKKKTAYVSIFFSPKTGKQISGVWIPSKLEVQEEALFKRNISEFFLLF